VGRKPNGSAMRSNEVNWFATGPSTRCPDRLLPCFSRDRLSFSKSILRRFIRDCVDRDAAVASPWTVKKPIADRYGVENIMPEETRKGVQEVKNKEIEKRKKVWEDKEGPPSKKQKKLEERGTHSHSHSGLA
jgi:bromodomain adjacent to zinc finger domain protein 1A